MRIEYKGTSMSCTALRSCIAGLMTTLALLPVLAQKADPAPQASVQAVLALPADKTRGQAAFDDCAGCHRKDASGRATGAIPRLSGQHASVIVKQVLDIRSGQRINPPMKPFVEASELSDQALADIASYLQSLPVAGRLGQGPGDSLARGQALFAKDCAACHGAQGEGRAEGFFPMVAAQHYPYLLRELGLIRDGGRGNSNPAMAALVKGYSEADLQAVADHMSRLPPPRR
jgi:cytochrome c553